MLLCLRLCVRRSPWKQQGSFVAALAKDSSLPRKLPAHIQRQTHTWLGRCVNAGRFYSQERQLPESVPEPVPEPSILAERPFTEQLQLCSSPSDVLDLTSRCPPSARQVSNSLTRMWATTKKMSEEQRRCELQLMFEHPAFHQLLQRAVRNVGSLRPDDLAYSLLGMVKLGVSERSRVVQTYLRACQEKLNAFDEKSLSILSSSLENMESSSNAAALKQGLRLIVESRLPEINNVMMLQTMMRVLGKDAPLQLKRKLEAKALSMSDQFSLPNSQHMISTLLAMDFYSKPLLDVCSRKITEDAHAVPFNRLFSVLHACRKLRYRDIGLLTSISDNFAASVDVWTNKQLVLLLSVFQSLDFCPDALMDAFAARVIANPDALTLADLQCVLKVYASLDWDLQHRQRFLDALSCVLDVYLPNMAAHQLLKTTYWLCLLSHFLPAALEKLLNSGTLELLSTTVPRFLPSQERMFQTIHLCLHLDGPVLPRPLAVPPPLLGDPVAGGPSTNQQLMQAVHRALGERGDAELQEGLVEERFYYIDAVIKPLLNQTHETDANSSMATAAQRVAVLFPPSSAFCYGSSRPRGPLAVKLRHLKILGYRPVLVRPSELRSVPEEHWGDFLRGRIFPEHQGSDNGGEER